MVVHSLDDDVVPIEYGFEPYYEKYSKDLRFTFIKFEDRGHSDVVNDSSDTYTDEVNAEFDKWLETLDYDRENILMMETNYIEIREITEDDARSFYDCMKSIDQETEYMMFEPDERVWNENLLKGKISDKSNLLIGAVKDGKIIGFLSAERERFRRNRHSAYIIIGIRKAYCHRGIGTQLFSKLDEWARTA